MLDLGISKLALIGAIALIVIGPEKLPQVARTVGALLGKAQRYVNQVKAEVSRNMELDELRKMHAEVDSQAREIGKSLATTAEEMKRHLDGEDMPEWDGMPQYRHPGKHWRVRQSAVPNWYKSRAGVRKYAQSGAARVARYRPKNYS